MKKFMMIAFLAVLSLTLFGCSEGKNIDDNLAPVIIGEDSYDIQVNNGDFDLSKLITIEDDVDGIIPLHTLMVDYKNFDVTVIGDYQILVLVSDSKGATTNKTITLHVIDTTPPTIELNGDEIVSIVAGNEYVELGSTMLDNYSTILKIVIIGTVDNDTVGQYGLEYYTEDESGNKSVSIFRTIYVTATIPEVDINSINLMQNSVTFDIDVIDVDQVGALTAIDLYQGNTLVQTLSDLSIRTFTGLQCNVEYTLRVTYSYDVSSGNNTDIEIDVEETFTIVEATDINEGSFYTSKDDVALYIETFHRLPDNYMTKSEAGGHISSHWSSSSMASIGGDDFQNRENLLPVANGRSYFEVDINYRGGSRGSERIVYSSDGFIFYTGDHYDSFVLYDPTTRDWNSYSKTDSIFDN